MQHHSPRPDDINERALRFVIDVLRFLRSLPVGPGVRRIADQLVGAAGGIGSNLEEACAASSRREFVRLNEIALRESRESIFWLRVCHGANFGESAARTTLLGEAGQIAKIIAANIVNTEGNGL